MLSRPHQGAELVLCDGRTVSPFLTIRQTTFYPKMDPSLLVRFEPISPRIWRGGCSGVVIRLEAHCGFTPQAGRFSRPSTRPGKDAGRYFGIAKADGLEASISLSSLRRTPDDRGAPDEAERLWRRKRNPSDGKDVQPLRGERQFVPNGWKIERAPCPMSVGLGGIKIGAQIVTGDLAVGGALDLKHTQRWHTLPLVERLPLDPKCGSEALRAARNFKSRSQHI